MAKKKNKFEDAFKKQTSSVKARLLYYALYDTCKTNEEREELYQAFSPVEDELSSKELRESLSLGYLTEYTADPVATH